MAVNVNRVEINKINRFFFTSKSMLSVSTDGLSVYFNMAKNKGDNENKDYDTKDGITVKFSMEEVGTIMHILNMYNTRGNTGFEFVKEFYKGKKDVDYIGFHHKTNNNNYTQIMFNVWTPENFNKKIPLLILSFKKVNDGNEKSINFGIAYQISYALEKTLECMFNECMFYRRVQESNNSSQSNNSGNSTNTETKSSGSNKNDNFSLDEDDFEF